MAIAFLIVPLTSSCTIKITEEMLYKLYIQAIQLPINERESFVRSQPISQQATTQLLEMLKEDDQDFTLSSQLLLESTAYQELLQIGDTISVYQLTDVLGKGGMGTVFKASRIDGIFAQTVAIKVISPLLKGTLDTTKLVYEANVMAKLQHHHICAVIDAGVTESGQHYIVMEYIQGTKGSNFFDDHLIPLKLKLSVYRDLCETIEYAHQQHVIHGDIKPDNLVIDDKLQLKVLDFGISQMLTSRQSAALTPVNKFHGVSNGYASPELVKGEGPSVSSDVYALGAIASKIIKSSVFASQKEDRELTCLVNKAMADSASDRYQAVWQLQQDIESYLNNQVISSYPANTLYRFKKLVVKRRPISSLLCLCVVVFCSLLMINLFTQYQQVQYEKKQSTIMFEQFSSALNLDLDKQSGIQLSLANHYASIGERIKSQQLYAEIIDRFSLLNNTDIAFEAGARLLTSLLDNKDYDAISNKLSVLKDKLSFIANSHLPVTENQAHFYHLWVNASSFKSTTVSNQLEHLALFNKLKSKYWQQYTQQNLHSQTTQKGIEFNATHHAIKSSFYYDPEPIDRLAKSKRLLQSLFSKYLTTRYETTTSKKLEDFVQTYPVTNHLTHENNKQLLKPTSDLLSHNISRDSLIYLTDETALFLSDKDAKLTILSHHNQMQSTVSPTWSAEGLMGKTWYHIYDRSVQSDGKAKATLMKMQFDPVFVTLQIANLIKKVPWYLKQNMLILDFSDQQPLFLPLNAYSEDHELKLLQNNLSSMFSLMTDNKFLANYIFNRWYLVEKMTH